MVKTGNWEAGVEAGVLLSHQAPAGEVQRVTQPLITMVVSMYQTSPLKTRLLPPSLFNKYG